MNHELMSQPEAVEQKNLAEQLEDGVVREIIGAQKGFSEGLEQTDSIVGNLEDTENWHPQAERLSCVVSIQEIVAEQLLDREISEEAVIDFAEQADWYDPREGSALMDTGNVLEAMGIEVERTFDTTLEDLTQALANGEKIICAVDNMILQDARFVDIPGREANHAVQLVAIDHSDPENPQIILNDTGVPNGRGVRHDLDVFMAAWKTSGNFAVFAGKEDAA